MKNPTCIRTYAHQFEAEAERSTLLSEGLDALLSSDDVGGELPGSFAPGGVRLLVESADVERAIQILKQQDTQGDGQKAPIERLAREAWRGTVLPLLILGGGFILAAILSEVSYELRIVIVVVSAVIAVRVRETAGPGS